MGKKVRTTAKYFAAFKHYCYEWQRALGLQRYDMSVIWTQMSSQADALVQRESMLAHIRLKKGGVEYKADRLAFHEVGEVLFWDLREIFEKYCKSNADIEQYDNAIHAILNTLETVIFDGVNIEEYKY